MKHFLGTRFNLKVPDWKTTKNGAIVLDETWLQRRIELFEKYCLPSVKNQSNQDFIWCVFFDIDTPKKYKEKITLMAEEYTNFYPVFIDGVAKLQEEFVTFIKKHLDASDTYVITTRMDNDDLIHKDFIKTIQLLYQPIHGAVIDIKKGYQVTLGTNNPEIRTYLHPFNAFVSVIEDVKNMETIYAKMHYGWKEASTVIGYKKRLLWIELVHETNKVNHTLSYLKKAASFSKEDFGLKDNFNFQIKTFNVITTNATIEVKNFQKSLKEHLKFIKKLPKRTIRFIRKKI